MRVLFNSMNMIITLCLLVSVAFAEDEVILHRGDISVTVDDVERYIVGNIPGEKRSEILQKKGIF